MADAIDESIDSHSCERCYKRKVRCDKAKPKCSHCTRQGVECLPSSVAGPSSSRKRKRRFPEAELLSRINLYEAKLKRLGVDISQLAAVDDDEDGGEGDQGQAAAAAAAAASHASSSREPAERRARIKQSPDTSLQEFDEIQSVIFPKDYEGSGHPAARANSKEAARPPTQPIKRKSNNAILSHFDHIFPTDGSGLLLFEPNDFPDAPIAEPVHPNPFEIFRLWGAYQEHVAPICKLLHTGTVHRLICRLGTSAHDFEPADHLLLFAIYATAANSMNDEQCTEALQRPRGELIQEYCRGVKFWLAKSSLWRCSHLQVLQAFTLVLTWCQGLMDPRTAICFTGIAERVARLHGLHRAQDTGVWFSAGMGGQTHVDVEMRRRTWWELFFLDSRSLLKSGLGASVIPNDWTTLLPSPLGDTELESLDPQRAKLSIEADDFSVSSLSSSDMVFCLIRAELARFLRDVRIDQGTSVGWFEFSTSQWTLSQKLRRIDAFEARLEEKYLKGVSESDTRALQRFSRIFAFANLASLRLSAYTSEESLQARRKGGASRVDAAGEESGVLALREKMLMLCNGIIEDYALLRRDPAFQRFQWWVVTHMPFIQMTHLVRLLTKHTTGPLVERAWQTIEQCETLFSGPSAADKKAPTTAQEGLRKKHMGSLFDASLIKAWTARRAGLQRPADRPDPEFIAKRKLRYASRSSNTQDSTTTQAQSDKMDVAKLLADQFGASSSSSSSTMSYPTPLNSSIRMSMGGSSAFDPASSSSSNQSWPTPSTESLASLLASPNEVHRGIQGECTAPQNAFANHTCGVNGHGGGENAATTTVDLDFDWENWIQTTLFGPVQQGTVASGGMGSSGKPSPMDDIFGSAAMPGPRY